MSPWLRGGRWVYRRLARTYPHDFRMTCGDGLERLGDDMLPIVFCEQGALGVLRMLADAAVRLPIEHLATWIGTLKEMAMTQDPFEGTWKANAAESQFDPKYSPEQACLRFEPTDTGYLLVAYGIKAQRTRGSLSSCSVASILPAPRSVTMWCEKGSTFITSLAPTCMRTPSSASMRSLTARQECATKVVRLTTM